MPWNEKGEGKIESYFVEFYFSWSSGFNQCHRVLFKIQVLSLYSVLGFRLGMEYFIYLMESLYLLEHIKTGIFT